MSEAQEQQEGHAWIEAKGREPVRLDMETDTDFLPPFPWEKQGHFQCQRMQVSVD